jgi:hypothetical protein
MLREEDEEDISGTNIPLALSEMNEPPQMTFRSPKLSDDPLSMEMRRKR